MEITTSNSKGTLTISEEVLSSIATNAAKDVDGVSSFSNRPVDVVSTIKQGSLKVMSPVRILQDGDNMNVSIYINLEPNKKIQDVAVNVQNNVREAMLLLRELILRSPATQKHLTKVKSNLAKIRRLKA